MYQNRQIIEIFSADSISLNKKKIHDSSCRVGNLINYRDKIEEP